SRTASRATNGARTAEIDTRLTNGLARSTWNGKPAVGTSLASTPVSVPRNDTSAPRARSSRPTARPGYTCPAVPPPAITIRMRPSPLPFHRRVAWIDGRRSSDRYQRAHRDQRHDQRRSSERHERQRDAGDRKHARGASEVDERLCPQPRRDARGEESAEGVRRADGDAHARVDEDAEERQHDQLAEETELLAEDREDEVGVCVRHVQPLLSARPEPHAEDSPGTERDERLNDLIPGVSRIVPRMEERQEPRPPVPRVHDQEHPGAERGHEPRRQQPQPYAGHEDQEEDGEGDQHRRPEVGLQDDQTHHGRGDDEDRDPPPPGVVQVTGVAGEDDRDRQDHGELGELGWLHREGTNGDP